MFHTQLKIHEVFDLKGSEYGRTNTSGHGPKKDLDWGSRKLQLPAEFGRKFVEQMEADRVEAAKRQQMPDASAAKRGR